MMRERYVSEEPEHCQLCNKKAIYRARTPAGVLIGACRDHQSIASDVMKAYTARFDSRYHAARSALKRYGTWVERGYNVGRKGQR